MEKIDTLCIKLSDSKNCPLDAIANKIKTVKISGKNRKMVFFERVI